MMVLALALLAASTPPPAPAPAAATPGLDGVPVRVERRLLEKANHFFFTGGADYFIRGDYYVSPGLMGTASWYATERSGFEVQAGLFVSFTSPAAQEVFDATGFVPDAQRPVFLCTLGYRHSLGYGKMMISGAPDSLVHFDFQLAGHAGFLVTDRAANVTASVGPSALVRFNSRLFVQVDLPVYVSFEQRHGWPIAVGVLPSVTGGVTF
jgi:hypothetical protein